MVAKIAPTSDLSNGFWLEAQLDPKSQFAGMARLTLTFVEIILPTPPDTALDGR